eukprot:6027408-Pyramimonas_sp.AAC.1
MLYYSIRLSSDAERVRTSDRMLCRPQEGPPAASHMEKIFGKHHRNSLVPPVSRILITPPDTSKRREGRKPNPRVGIK